MPHAAAIHCRTKLLRPASPKAARWLVVVLPQAASAQLPTRRMTTVDGMLDGQVFRVTLEPDGHGSHWFKIEHALRDAAGVAAGDVVELLLIPEAEEPEPTVPADVRKALGAHPEAKAQWKTLTPVQRRDWIHWVTSGKRAETRVKRLTTACDMLGSGKRRACCFDRSGIYSKGIMGAPEAVGA